MACLLRYIALMMTNDFVLEAVLVKSFKEEI